MEQDNNLIIDKFTDPYIFSNISIINFTFNLILAIILSLLISYTYCKYGRNISNRKEFSQNFTILAITTMFIITIVKSSLALSLGLVGALSIVRFRSAIKDPEELTYLFFTIGVGLGLGANQLGITIVATFLTLIFIILRAKLLKRTKDQFINLNINLPKEKNNNIDNIIKTLSNYSSSLNLRRYTQDDNYHELFINLNISSFNQVQLMIDELSKVYPGITIDLIDKNNLD